MWWLGAVCPTADGPAAHLDHAVLSIVDGLDADLVYTHVDRTDVVARTAMTARLRGEPSSTELAALEERLRGPASSCREGHLHDAHRREGHLRDIPNGLAGPPDGARCVRFPGQERFTGVVPAIELVAHSAIDEVAGIGVPVGPDTLVDTMGFLRPTYTSGRLVLLVEPAAGGVLRPVEIEQPHQCCGGH